MMKKSGELLQNTLIPFLKGTFDNYQEEHQNSEYESFSFSINQYSFRNRLAKKTPTKKGYFVVFWEKDNNNKNKAFDYKNSPDFLIVNVFDNEHKGLFVFPKSELLKQKILRTSQVKGKMAIRVYPLWEQSLNKTAEKYRQCCTSGNHVHPAVDESSLFLHKNGSLRAYYQINRKLP